MVALSLAVLASCAKTSRRSLDGVAPTACAGTAPTGETCCDNGDGTGSWRATQTDPNHCGGCGVRCPSGTVCALGTCSAAGLQDAGGLDGGRASTCSAGCAASERCCDGACVSRSVAAGIDGRDDPSFQNCGSCGNTCDPMLASACTGGGGTAQCACGTLSPCAPGTQCLLDEAAGAFRCVDLQRDADNCGAPGNRCEDGEECQMGRCVCAGAGRACGAGEACCDGACVDINSDSSHCGGCGNSCGANGPICVGGACRCGERAACRPPTTGIIPDLGESCCEGACVENTDADCGCGDVCEGDERCLIGTGGLPFPGFPPDTGICCGVGLPGFAFCAP